MKMIVAVMGLACVVGLSVNAWAECRVLTTPPTYIQGELTDDVCDVNASRTTSAGAVRITSLGSVTSATSSAVSSVPTGPKTFMGQIINSTSSTKATTALIYGNWTSSTTGGILLCTLTLPSTAAVLQLQDACPVVTANFAYYYYTATAYTSASGAPFTIYAMY